VADMNRPPRGLGADGRRLWKAVVDEYDLLGHQFELLRLAAQALDRASQARTVLDRDGLTVSTTTGVKSHPAAAIERDSRLAVARLLRELALEVDDPVSMPARPPRLRVAR
jgi:hypothetical protein